MIDFLIIGQGLAGSLLAWELMQRGYSVIIVDNGQENASQIAAGLINPVTGMRFVKPENIGTLISNASGVYKQLELFFQCPFFIEKPMLRIVRTEKELAEAEKRMKNPEYLPYIGDIQKHPITHFDTPFGFLEQKQTGYVLTRPLLESLKAFFIAQKSYRKAELDYGEIKFEPTLHWQNIHPKQIIFCEGYLATRNPWFRWLPFQPVKGEILTLQHQWPLPDRILNYGNWLIPMNDSQIRIGSTFDRENLNTQISEAGRKEMLNQLSQVSSGLARSAVIGHVANIRPATLDRNPFIGKHPEYENIHIFNGFGAKGSLQIPWYGQRFADSLLKGVPLPPMCDIRRYTKTYYK